MRRRSFPPVKDIREHLTPKDHSEAYMNPGRLRALASKGKISLKLAISATISMNLCTTQDVSIGTYRGEKADPKTECVYLCEWLDQFLNQAGG